MKSFEILGIAIQILRDVSRNCRVKDLKYLQVVVAIRYSLHKQMLSLQRSGPNSPVRDQAQIRASVRFYCVVATMMNVGIESRHLICRQSLHALTKGSHRHPKIIPEEQSANFPPFNIFASPIIEVVMSNHRRMPYRP